MNPFCNDLGKYISSGNPEQRWTLIADGYIDRLQKATSSEPDLLQWHLVNLEDYALTVAMIFGVIQKDTDKSSLMLSDIFFRFTTCVKHLDAFLHDLPEPVPWNDIWMQFLTLLEVISSVNNPQADLRPAIRLLSVTSSYLKAAASGTVGNMCEQCVQFARELPLSIEITLDSDEQIKNRIAENISTEIANIERGKR